MTTDVNDKLLAELFADTAELSAADREVFLARECANHPVLLAELRVLLSAHERVESEGFLRQSAFEEAHQFTYEDRTGQTAGRYLFLELIGEGGMGEVYRAEDTELNRLVAIKLIHSGLKTKEILRRFDNERQILAQLSHDNISRLIDAGTTKDSVPFLVMEYIEGKPLDVYCEVNKLNVNERLRLFRTICAGVQYAHQHLIVHRDLKPSNVLVTEQGQPKLLDFGIAKLVDSTTEPDATATLMQVMTPEYASPEQVKGEGITTATDVYSLGVLLYELLTGRRPYRFKSRTPDEVARVVCEQEPDRPSVARSVRQIGPPASAPAPRDSNQKLLRGDLDNIVLKALRKEPARRYQSVADLSEDIRRFLNREPIKASKDTFRYRASKFIQRNKVSVSAVAAIGLVLILGGVATAWEAHKARLQRAIAEERFNEVRQIAHSVMFDYHDAIATLPGSTKVREQMVKDSLNYLDKLAPQAGGDMGLQREIASAYLKVGDVQGRPFFANLGDTKGALESYQKSLSIRKRLAALEPNNTEVSAELGMSYERIGRIQTAMGNPAAALEDLQQSTTIYEDLLRTNPTNRGIRGELALVDMTMGIASGFSATNSLGDTKRGMEYQRKALGILEPLVAEEPTNLTYRKYLTGVYNFTAGLYFDSGNQAEALNNYRKALDVDQALAQESPTDTYTQRELAVDYSNTCNVMRSMGDMTGSIENGQHALVIFEKMASADPEDANIAKDLAIMHQNIGVTLTKEKDYAAASEHYRTSIRILDQLAAKNPTDAELQMRKEWGYYRLSDVESLSGDIAHAIEHGQHARGVLESLVAANSRNSTAARYLAVVYSQLGKCDTLLATKSSATSGQRINHWREARDWFQKSLDIYQDMKNNGTLSGADASKPDELAKEIAKSDAAISAGVGK